ncbi:MAG: DUF5684 domain-containing protein [Thermodesulfobacteriota bacterium]
MDEFSRGLLGFVAILVFIFLFYCIKILARKTDTKNENFAWIPILNVYLLCKIARKPGWWVILFLIPIVNIIISTIIWMNISELRGRSKWLGLICLFPYAVILLIPYLAFFDANHSES